MVPPSRDQTGFVSSWGSNVKRALLFLCKSKIHKSTFFALLQMLSKATRRPSGEIEGLATMPAEPTPPSSLPASSNHVNSERLAKLLLQSPRVGGTAPQSG